MPQSIITATARTKFGELWEMSLPELALQAGRECLNNAEQRLESVDTLYVVSRFSGAFNQLSVPEAVIREALGFVGRTQFWLDAGQALQSAAELIALGQAKQVLLIAVDKCTDAPAERHRDVLAETLHPEEYQDGLTVAAAYGLRAQAYLEKYGLTEFALSAPVIQAHARGESNPQAQYPFLLTSEAIAASTVVASPLRSLHLASLADGAAALLLRADDAMEGVGLRSMAQGNAPLGLAQRTALFQDEATALAASQLSIAFDKVVALELEDRYAIDALQAAEAIGFAAPGPAPTWFEALPNLSLAVNATGGHKANGYPGAAGELRQFIDVVSALVPAPSGSLGLVQQAAGSGYRSTLFLLEKN